MKLESGNTTYSEILHAYPQHILLNIRGWYLLVPTRAVMVLGGGGGEPEPEVTGDERPKVDLTGLALEMEQEASVRTFLREQKIPLFNDKMNPETVKAVDDDHVYAIIKILLNRTAHVEGHPSPPVNPLREELAELYRKCSVVADESTVHTDSWCIRKIIAFVKMKVRRSKVSTVT